MGFFKPILILSWTQRGRVVGRACNNPNFHFKKLVGKKSINAINHKNRVPPSPYFPTTPSTTLKRICKKKSRTPLPGVSTTVHLLPDVIVPIVLVEVLIIIVDRTSQAYIFPLFAILYYFVCKCSNREREGRGIIF